MISLKQITAAAIVAVLAVLVHSTAFGEAFPPVWPAKARMNQKVAELCTERKDVLFIGDSLVQLLEVQPSDAVWRKYYGGRNAINLGFAADFTASTEWRMDHGLLRCATPRLIVLLIGTNDFVLGSSGGDVADAIVRLVLKLHDAVPAAEIIVLGILPSGIDDYRSRGSAVANSILADRLRSTRDTVFVDPSTHFLNGNTVDKTLFVEADKPLHINSAGYEVLLSTIEPTVAGFLGDGTKAFR